MHLFKLYYILDDIVLFKEVKGLNIVQYQAYFTYGNPNLNELSHYGFTPSVSIENQGE